MTPDDFVSQVVHGGRYRVSFESRSSWVATVLVAGGELRLRYEGGSAPRQTFLLVPDREGHLIARGKPWGRLTTVTLSRV